MQIFKVKRLDDAAEVVDRLLDSVGEADPRIDIQITAVITKEKSRNGSTELSPEISSPLSGGAISASIKTDIARDFARRGEGFVLVEITRHARVEGESEITRAARALEGNENPSYTPEDRRASVRDQWPSGGAYYT